MDISDFLGLEGHRQENMMLVKRRKNKIFGLKE